MRKKLIALLSAVSLLVAYSTTCFAAQQLPITHANQYVFSVRGGEITSILFLTLVTIQ